MHVAATGVAVWRASHPREADCTGPFELAAAALGEGGALWTAAVGCAGQGEKGSSAGHAPLRGPARLLFDQRIDLNAADERLLQVLPGIGPSRARAIARERARRRFATVAELRRVHGIGPATVARLAPWVFVDPLDEPPEPIEPLEPIAPSEPIGSPQATGPPGPAAPGEPTGPSGRVSRRPGRRPAQRSVDPS